MKDKIKKEIQESSGFNDDQHKANIKKKINQLENQKINLDLQIKKLQKMAV